MEYRNLGNTGLKVSAVGLGSWLTVGSRVGLDTTKSLLRTAIDAGINFVDTADIYARGEAERTLGEALEDYRRESLVLASKCYFPMSDGPNDQGLSRKHIMESIEGSLTRLGTDYLDLYQCHRFDEETPTEETVRAMEDLCRQGKILHWGVSCWTADQIRDAVALANETGGYAPISNQPPYNLIQRDIEEEVIPTCEELGLGQIVFSPLAQGILTGKYSGGTIPEGSRADDEKRNQFMKPRMTEENLDAVDRLKPIAADLGISLPQLALAWCLRKKNVASVIIGATKSEQVRENAEAADIHLDPETTEKIERAWANK